MCERPHLQPIVLSMVSAAVLTLLPLGVAGKADEFLLAQNTPIPTPGQPFGGNDGPASRLIENVPTVNALDPEEVERLGTTAVERTRQERARQVLDQYLRTQSHRASRNYYRRNDIDGPLGEKLDCDDHKASVHPNAVEVCNGIDDNCNDYVDEVYDANGEIVEGGLRTLIFADLDADGYGGRDVEPQSVCLHGNIINQLSIELAEWAVRNNRSKGARYVLIGGDCNDSNSNVNPKKDRWCE